MIDYEVSGQADALLKDTPSINYGTHPYAVESMLLPVKLRLGILGGHDKKKN